MIPKPACIKKIDKVMDSATDIANIRAYPRMFLLNPVQWTEVEGYLQEVISARYEKSRVRGYDRVNPDFSITPGKMHSTPKQGFKSLTYRARPLVCFTYNDPQESIVSAILDKGDVVAIW